MEKMKEGKQGLYAGEEDMKQFIGIDEKEVIYRENSSKASCRRLLD